MTIKNILKKYPEEEVTDILAHVLGKTKEFLYLNPEWQVTSGKWQVFQSKYKRFQKGEPLAYILGFKYFYGLKFKVNKNVLIPRPETEWVVEKVVSFLSLRGVRDEAIQFVPRKDDGLLRRSQGLASRNDNSKASRLSYHVSLLDLATGSGCVAVSIADQLRVASCELRAKITASDISEKSLAVARQNAKYNLSLNPPPRKGRETNQISFIQSDLFENIKGKFDIITANLPYVPLSRYEQLVKSQDGVLSLRGRLGTKQSRFVTTGLPRRSQSLAPRNDRSISSNIAFEPKGALTDGTNTWDLYERFFIELPKHLNPGGMAILEIDESSQPRLNKMIKKTLPDFKAKFSKDIRGFWRYLELYCIL